MARSNEADDETAEWSEEDEEEDEDEDDEGLSVARSDELSPNGCKSTTRHQSKSQNHIMMPQNIKIVRNSPTFTNIQQHLQTLAFASPHKSSANIWNADLHADAVIAVAHEVDARHDLGAARAQLVVLEAAAGHAQEGRRQEHAAVGKSKIPQQGQFKRELSIMKAID